MELTLLEQNCHFCCLLCEWLKSGYLKRGPRLPLGATERFFGAHEQRPSLGSFAVILRNPSVTIC